MRKVWLLLPVLLWPATANAHQYWVEPNEFFFFTQTEAMDDKVSENLTFDFSGADVYFNPDINRAAESDQYTLTITQPDGSALKPTATFNGKTRLVGEAALKQRGTYLLSVARTGEPMYYCKLKDASWVEKARDALSTEEAEGAHCGGYFQYTKAYVTLHTPTDLWKESVGQALEIVPLSHPGTVFAGDTLKVKLLAGGKPLADTKIVGIYQGFRAKEHGQTPLAATTDKNGEASFTFTRASRWLLTAKQEIPNQDTAKAESTTHQASLMLEVNEPWVREWLSAE